MRVVVDYRPALRARTGVGEYVHHLATAYARRQRAGDALVLFSSSWKDRLPREAGAAMRADVSDHRIPVRALNWLWHRRGWPPIERLTGPADVVHALHPLLIPASRAAQVVTIHDLHFLTHPEHSAREIRRDYPLLAARHARRADAVVANSAYTARLVELTFSVPADRIFVCPPGAPAWRTLGRGPNVPRDGYILFIGTLDPRKHVGSLLDAYALALGREPRLPALVVAGAMAPGAEAWAARWAQAPLAGRVDYRGYVPDADREALFAGARLLVLPSLDEGFGIPVLEAMAAGVPVLVSNRGALPEVAGDAGVVIDPDDADAFATALIRLTTDDDEATAAAHRGLARARAYTWDAAASRLRDAYESAVTRRSERG
ncbi:MAG: glycosyltransferase family 4 protein [Vicinamibacterales bacterium]